MGGIARAVRILSEQSTKTVVSFFGPRLCRNRNRRLKAAGESNVTGETPRRSAGAVRRSPDYFCDHVDQGLLHPDAMSRAGNRCHPRVADVEATSGELERAARVHRRDRATWPVADDVRPEEVDVDGAPGRMVDRRERCRVCADVFPGGGYCSGSIVSHRRMVTEAAARRARARWRAYGSRPSILTPAAHEDATTAWRFLRGQGIAARDIVSAATVPRKSHPHVDQPAARSGEEQPACAWLASPWTDLTMSGASLETKATVDPLIHKAYLEELAQCGRADTDRP